MAGPLPFGGALMDGIQQMFSELMGYDEYDQQLTLWCLRQRVINGQKSKRLGDWKRLNRKRQREHVRRWEKNNPDKVRARKARWRSANPNADKASKDRYRAANREKVREWNRRNQAKRRERLKAEAQKQRRAA